MKKSHLLLLGMFLLIGLVCGLYQNFLVSGYVFGSFAVMCYYATIYIGVNDKFFIKELKKISPREMFYIFLMYAISVLFVLKESSINDVIYSWDSYINWCPAVSLSTTLFNNTFNALGSVISSINNQDYNDFLGLVMALPLRLLGLDFYLFTLLVWIMFGIPAGFILVITIRHVFDKIGWCGVSYTILTAIYLLIPAITSQIFYGYAYINFLLPGAVLFWILVTRDYSDFDLQKNISISLMTILLVISNRTSTYMVIGYLLSLMSMYLWECYATKEYRLYLSSVIKNLSFILCFNIITLLVFFKGFFYRSLFNNFKEAYAAYGLGRDFIDKIWGTIDYWGILIVVFICFGFLVSWILSLQIRKYILAYSISVLVPVVMLNMILQMNGHQMYDVVIPVYFLLAVLYASLHQIQSVRKIGTSIFIACLCLNFLYGYSGIYTLPQIFGNVHKPLVRDDVNTIRYIVSKIDEIAGDNKKVYVIASGVTFNDDVFRWAEFPKQLVSLPTIQSAPHVDLRDGFFDTFLDADIVVVTDPVQLHLRKQDQQVVTIPAEIMLGNNRISKHYKLLDEYYTYPNKKDVNSRITVKVFEKTTDLSIEDIDYIEQKYDTAYPDHPELFHDRFEKYKERM